MKNLFAVIKPFAKFIAFVILTLAMTGLASQTDDSDFGDMMDDFDSMFEEAEDTVGQEAENGPSIAASDSGKDFSFLEFYGTVNASLGLVDEIWPTPQLLPYASFNSTVGFKAAPSDVFTIRGSIYAEFPSMEWALDTMYFDYIFLNRLYITAGRTSISWGNTNIFDSNILDDKSSTINPDISILDVDDYEVKKTFEAIATLPIGHGEIEALAIYSATDTLSYGNISYAVSVEYPILGFAAKLFGRMWGSNDAYALPPAIGLELTRDILGFHTTLWTAFHIPAEYPTKLELARGIAGIGRYWEEYKLAFVAEYELIYEDEGFNNYAGLQATWRHMLGSRLSPMVQWFFDINGLCGSFIPSITISGIPYGSLTVLLPIFYGNQSSSYNGMTVNSTSGEPVVMLGAVVSLNLPF